MSRPHYLLRLGDALSQLLNVAILNGDANESISGRAHREGWKTAERIIDTLFRPIGSAHCRTAYRADLSRAWEMTVTSK